MKLLDLPLELIREILKTAVAGNGPTDANTYCMICKLFREEIPPIVYQLRLLETCPGGGKGWYNIKSDCKYKRLYVSYLTNWTVDIARPDEDHWMPALIRRIRELLLAAAPELESRRDQITATLCAAMTGEHGESFAAYMISPSMPHPSVGWYPFRRWSGTDQMNLLGVACLLGLPILVAQLLERGTRIRTVHFGHPLLNAVRGGHFEIAKAIYHRRGKTQLVDAYGKAIGIAALRGEDEILQFLMEDWSIPEARKGEVGKYSEHWPRLLLAAESAAKSGHIHTIQYLLQYVHDYRLLSPENLVPYPELAPPQDPRKRAILTSLECIHSHILFPAIQYGHQPLIGFVLSNGANPNRSYKLISYLEHAIFYDREEITRLLLQYGASPDNEGFSLVATTDEEALSSVYKEFAPEMSHWELHRGFQLPRGTVPITRRLWNRDPTWIWRRKDSDQLVDVFDPSDAEDRILEFIFHRQCWLVPSHGTSRSPLTRRWWNIRNAALRPEVVEAVQATYDREGHFERGKPMKLALKKKMEGTVSLLLEYGATMPTKVEKSMNAADEG